MFHFQTRIGALYIVLYGMFKVTDSLKLAPGATAGEELLFETSAQNVYRWTAAFTVSCDSERCCVLQMSVEDFERMAQSYKKDFKTLVSVLKLNYERKLPFRS